MIANSNLHLPHISFEKKLSLIWVLKICSPALTLIILAMVLFPDPGKPLSKIVSFGGRRNRPGTATRSSMVTTVPSGRTSSSLLKKIIEQNKHCKHT